MPRKTMRLYEPRVVGGKLMMPADLQRLHKYMLEIESVDAISDEMRGVLEQLWPRCSIASISTSRCGITFCFRRWRA
jgi:hypothetical protein